MGLVESPIGSRLHNPRHAEASAVHMHRLSALAGARRFAHEATRPRRRMFAALALSYSVAPESVETARLSSMI